VSLISMAFYEFSITSAVEVQRWFIVFLRSEHFLFLRKICGGKKYAKLGDPSISSLSYIRAWVA